MKLQGAHRNSDALLGLSLCVYVRQRSCGVNCGEDSQNPAILLGFSAVLSHFLSFQSASDSVIRWFESSYPSQNRAIFSDFLLKIALLFAFGKFLGSNIGKFCPRLLPIFVA